MLGIFRFFAIFFLIIVLLGYISRFLLRFFVKRMQKRYEKNQQQGRYKRKEGEVHVTKTPPKEKIVDKDVGEYVDYEEVDD